MSKSALAQAHLSARVPEPVARQVFALCVSLSRLTEQLDKLDAVLRQAEEVQRERAASHA